MELFIRIACLLGITLTAISIVYESEGKIYAALIIPYLILLGPYMLILMAYEIKPKVSGKGIKIYVFIIIFIFVASIFAHGLMHSHHGPDGWGLSALWAYIVAIIGDLLGLILLINALIQLKRFENTHNKSFKPTPKSGAV